MYLKRQFEDEVDRYNKFQHTVLRMHGKESEIEKKQSFDIRTYAKYILKEGRMIEKRELLASLKSRLVLTRDKKLILRKYETALI